ncbi:MAG TPA: glycosyltransferase family 2 protein [Flavobacteriaceae bacterium]|nr:glycosyltransferase family 2 protein [Flavobacteriaceae bacterium]
MEKPTISVIISTYNAEKWLEKTLWGYHAQTRKNFEVVIADDGSKRPTFDLLEKLKPELHFPIIHVWHEDNGFQKSQILNKALLKCTADYILMSDGDCIPRKDFISSHLYFRERGYFLSGGYFKLPMEISKKISKENILSQDCFELDWLKKKGLKSSFKNKKLTARGMERSLLNLFTPTTASWNGHNASGWKKDILAINGFDERMQYGGQDRELGERLFNFGIRSKQIRYSAVCLHLDHPRGYKTQSSIDKNLKIRSETKNNKKTWTDFGLEKEKN